MEGFEVKGGGRDGWIGGGGWVGGGWWGVGKKVG
jgi:hypothetical protein